MARPSWIVVFLLALMPCIVRAQSSDDLIAQGVALREEGRDEEALALFEQAYQDAGTGEALAQIALAETALARPVEAEAHLVSALAQSDDRFIRRNRAALQQALEELRAGLGDLEVHGPDGAEVWIGEASRGILPLEGPIRVALGTVHVEVRAAGYVSFESSVEVAAGAVASIDATLVTAPSLVTAHVRPRDPLEPEPVPDDMPPPPPPRSESLFLPVGIAAAGLGVVLVAVASGLMVMREDAAHTRLTCSDVDPGCRAQFQTAVDAEAAGVALYVLGGMFAIGGGVLVGLALFGDRESGSALSCAPGVLSVGCSARF